MMSSTLMESTSDTPLTDASPQEATMTVSIMPMVTDSVCSSSRGMSSRFSSVLVNMGCSGTLPGCLCKGFMQCSLQPCGGIQANRPTMGR